ncbi:MAG TPA: hypothetical protein PKX22_06520 [Rectinema sp.]|nr:hypothetical protein [Rectinema sp.]HNZ93862.1 hypothetical protein [Rectinema sp.]HPW47062.1 hypothetical protein [Rectinema sp.]HQG15488.1 hypothetical protein [Rectinema sp.]HQH88521.1 hypothetical protein [Rectinema sp.]
MESKRLEDFKANPQAFIDIAIKTINDCKHIALVDGIKYERIGNDYYYAQELFLNKELSGYLHNMLDVRNQKKSVY